MQQFLSNGGLSKMLWIILTFVVGLGAVIVAGIEIVGGRTPDPYVASILTGILAHVFTVGGSVNTSSQLESANAKSHTETMQTVMQSSQLTPSTGGTNANTLPTTQA